MATNAPQDDWHKTGLRMPRELHERLHEAAAESGRSYNAEIVARLQASFGSMQASMRGFEMTAQMDAHSDKPLTPVQMELAKAVATEAVKQVVALRFEGLDVVTAGRATAVFTPPPGQNSMVKPFDAEAAAKRYADRLESIMADREEKLRAWWEAEFGYDPQAPKVELPASKGPSRSSNARKRT